MQKTPHYPPGISLTARTAHDGEMFVCTDDAWEFELAGIKDRARELAGCGDEVTGAVRRVGRGYVVEIRCGNQVLGYAPGDLAGLIITTIAERGPGILSGTLLIADDGLRIHLALFTQIEELRPEDLPTETSAGEVFAVYRLDVDASAGAAN